MRLWRLAFGDYNHLDGEGARLSGGRWNSPGIPVVYAASHLTLALLEQLVHFRSAELPSQYRAFVIDLPTDAAIETADAGPGMVQDTEACRRVGDAWAASRRSVALVIPSIIIPPALAPGAVATVERNVMLNPMHARSADWQVAETTFRVDPRHSGRAGRATISAAR